MKRIVNNALRSLLYEAVTLPKPGLVDPADSGSHSDMDIYTFIDSSLSMEQYLIKAAAIGENFGQNNLTEMFKELRLAGIEAEKSMLQATKGINTHKGAIFSLGIFVCARSFASKNNDDTFNVIRQMCNGLVKSDFEKIHRPKTAGEKQFLKYKKAGVRKLAEDGYPVIEKLALPYLEQSHGTIEQRLLNTLMLLAVKVDDSTFIKRSGDIEKLGWLHQVAQEFLDKGGSQTKEGMTYLKKLNQVFKQNNYSIGGCADLLIVTIFMALEDGKLG